MVQWPAEFPGVGWMGLAPVTHESSISRVGDPEQIKECHLCRGKERREGRIDLGKRSDWQEIEGFDGWRHVSSCLKVGMQLTSREKSLHEEFKEICEDFEIIRIVYARKLATYK